MKKPIQQKLSVNLGASQTRRRLKGFGHGVKRAATDGKHQAVIFHTATGQHLRELENLFSDVLRRLAPRQEAETITQEPPQ